MDTIDSTNAHYIRCIKPNEAKQAWEFEPPMVLAQLRACGVLETIKISCAGYPTRWSFDEFAQRYYMLVGSETWSAGGDDIRALCSKILEATIKDADRYQIGLTKIFFRAGLLARFEQLRTNRLNELAIVLQKNTKRWLAMSRYKRIRAAVIGIQVAWRATLARRAAEATRREKAALVLQRNLRGYAQRNRFLTARKAILGVQSRECHSHI